MTVALFAGLQYPESSGALLRRRNGLSPWLEIYCQSDRIWIIGLHHQGRIDNGFDDGRSNERRYGQICRYL